jgi:hypothetical protein
MNFMWNLRNIQLIILLKALDRSIILIIGIFDEIQIQEVYCIGHSLSGSWWFVLLAG